MEGAWDSAWGVIAGCFFKIAATAGFALLFYFRARRAEVAELADAPDSGSGVGNHVGVQIPPSAPLRIKGIREITRIPFFLSPFICHYFVTVFSAINLSMEMKAGWNGHPLHPVFRQISIYEYIEYPTFPSHYRLIEGIGKLCFLVRVRRIYLIPCQTDCRS